MGGYGEPLGKQNCKQMCVNQRKTRNEATRYEMDSSDIWQPELKAQLGAMLSKTHAQSRGVNKWYPSQIHVPAKGVRFLARQGCPRRSSESPSCHHGIVVDNPITPSRLHA